MNKKEIMSELKKCTRCHRGEYSPFYFNMQNQRVMVITACPSMQAEYKALTSIRFFRKLCIALFGDADLNSQYLTEICKGSVYWTHYYKCYNPHCTDFANLPDKCAKHYLKDEIKALKPEVIIVFGDEIKDRVCGIVSEVSDVVPICKPFPDTGSETEYDSVRNAVKKYTKFIKYTDCFISGKYTYSNDDSSGADVHMRFELKAFEHLICSNNTTEEQSIEDAWYSKIVLPNMKMYQNAVSTYSFIENQINVFLHDYVVRTGNYTFLSKVKNNAVAKKPNYKDVSDAINKSIIVSFKDYLIYRQEPIAPRYGDFLRKFDLLRLVRNCIVHNGGYLKENADEIRNGIDILSGVSILGNTIYIDNTANEVFLSMTNEVTEKLKQLS